MPIAIGNKRLPVTLDEKRQKELQQLKQKYGKSESRIMCIALDLLIAQEKAGFEVPALKSDVTFYPKTKSDSTFNYKKLEY
ncbi:hypothetical protein [Enterococcus faecium]|uniref:hypothetical protein n=1 Tax=Enterococcus faecium TaxID=1352 RepID=UPI000BA0B053|nr:hypothetical protein [Enterococcus faecium]OZN09540.1 hypothetical protein CF593_15495 [Enterococcus faecium]